MDPAAQGLAGVRDEHDLVIVHDLRHADDRPVARRGADRDHPLSAAPLEPVVVERRALAEAVLRRGQDRGPRGEDLHADDRVLGAKPHAAHAGRGAAHRPHLFLGEADRLALPAGDQHLLAPVRAQRRDQLVVVAEVDRDDPAAPRVRVGLEPRLLHHAPPRSEKHEVPRRLLEAAHGQRGAHPLAFRQLERVHERLAACGAPEQRELVDLEPVDAPARGEEEDVGVGRGDEEAIDEVLLPGLGALDALPAAALRAVLREGRPLDVARVGDGHHHLLLDDQVLGADATHRGTDLAAALVAVPLPDLLELRDDRLEDPRVAGEEALEIRDPCPDLLELGEDPPALERRQRAQPHLEDRVRLRLGELEARHQLRARGGAVLGGADDRDHGVEVLEGDREALEQVRARAGLREVVGGAPHHHLAAEVDEVAQRLLEREELRPAVGEREQVHAEGRLERRLHVELVQDHLFRGFPAQLDHDADPLAVRLVADVRHAVDPALAHQLGDALLQRGLVHHEGDLGHDDALVAAAILLEASAGAQRDRAATRGVGLSDPVGAADDRPGREVRTGHPLHQVLERALGMPRLVDQRVDELAQVVRRDVRRHADRDARRAVREQVGEARREHERLVDGAVEVRPEVDRLAVDVAEQLLRDRGEPGLGVAVGGGRVAVDRAEVALAVDERVAQGEFLGHPHHRVVDGGVAVRVVVLEHLADDAGGLRVGAVGEEPLLLHRVEDAAVDGLEAVAHVREGAADDDGHRVVEEGAPDLVLDVDRLRGGAGRRHAAVTRRPVSLVLRIVRHGGPRRRGSARRARCAR